MSSEVARYFDRLRAHLRLDGVVEADLVRELATHIDDRVDELVLRGVPAERAQRMAIRGFGRPRTLAHLVRQAHLVTSKRDALAGAAAFMLCVLVLGTGLWQQPLAAVAAGALVVGVTLYGLWAGRPAWFYPWAGVALTIPVVVGYIAFALLHREMPRLAAGEATPLTLAGIAGAGLYFPVGLVVVAAAVLVAVRRDWLDASILLSPLPCVLVWVIALHRAGGLAAAGGGLTQTSAMLGGVYTCMSVATLLFLRAPVRSFKVTVLVASALLLLFGSSLLIDPAPDLVMLGGRSALLVGFLLSPALIARHA